MVKRELSLKRKSLNIQKQVFVQPLTCGYELSVETERKRLDTQLAKIILFSVSGLTLRGRDETWKGNHRVTLEGAGSHVAGT